MTSLVTIQNALNAGELAPSLIGRTDLSKYQSGTTTCRNFFANYRGGVSSRAGLAYVGTCKQSGSDLPPRDIPFQFSLTQGYVLEFGTEYLRFKTNGAYITEAAKNVTSVSTAGLFTVASHGYSVGDWIYDLGNTGFSGLTWIVATVPTGNTFIVTDLFGNAVSSATASSGGTVARIYTVTTPYQAEDLPYLKYTQSADVMTLVCVNPETGVEYPPHALSRVSEASWTLVEEDFESDITPPSNLSATAHSSSTLTTWYSYVVTAVSSETGEESVASEVVSVQNNDIALYAGSNIIAWDAVEGADSYNVYGATPAYSSTVPVSSLFGFLGTALGPSFTDTNISADFTKVPPVHNNPFALGAITGVTPTAGGSNYSQSTIGYSITTSTGSGFSGTPVVADGSFVGFIINNKGSGYDPADTITLTDSGGGVATGYITWGGNPSDGEHVTFNGVKYTFRNDPDPSNPGDFQIESTLALTLQSLSSFLNTQTRLSLFVATYTSDATKIYVSYKTPGSAGNAYTLAASTATPSGGTLTGGGTAGTGATADLVIGEDSGTYPSVVAYFQQRRVYANSINKPDTYWMSQPGLYNNMDSSIPVVASDSITGTPWAQQVNGIQALVPMPGGLVVLTGNGAWQVNGGQEASITPSNQTAIAQAYNGCTDIVTPIQINNDILYIQAKGYTPRDLSYNFFNNIYTGTDLSVLSNHLFQDYQIIQWTWAEEPYKIVWAVRNDGVLLALTYLKEQEVYSWTRHDTNGLFQSVCSITELPVDAVYVITKRYIQDQWMYYSERMDNRDWQNVEDSFCVDSGLRNTLTYPDATLSPEAAEGEDIRFTASSAVFSADNVGDIIRIGGGKAEIVTYVNTTNVDCDILETITNVLPDDPDGLPIPAESGDWSIAEPFTTFSGLNHLEGLEVAILADGSVVENQVVTDGEIELEEEASLVVVGLPYTCQVQTMYYDVPMQGNSLQNRRKKVVSLGVRVEATRGLSAGADQPDQSFQQNNASVEWTDMSELKERTPQDFMGTAIPLYTGDYYKNIDSSWAIEGQAALQQSYPLPANILSVIFYVSTGDDR